MTIPAKATAIGINHIALEVDDIAEALIFYGKFLNFKIASQTENAAFIYFGDQFINFAKDRSQNPDERRHFGIAVDDKELVRNTLIDMGVTLLDGPFLDFMGIVDEIYPDRLKVKVLVSFFGRETPVELDFMQIEKA